MEPDDGRTSDPIALLGSVVDAIPAVALDLTADDLMVVGAHCRDLHHHGLGHAFEPAATRDLDLALAARSWADFEAIAASCPRLETSGIRFLIADVPVDLLPFGLVEDPTGHSEPPGRGEPFSVWAFSEIHPVWPGEKRQRRELIEAFTRGLTTTASGLSP